MYLWKQISWESTSSLRILLVKVDSDDLLDFETVRGPQHSGEEGSYFVCSPAIVFGGGIRVSSPKQIGMKDMWFAANFGCKSYMKSFTLIRSHLDVIFLQEFIVRRYDFTLVDSSKMNVVQRCFPELGYSNKNCTMIMLGSLKNSADSSLQHCPIPCTDGIFTYIWLIFHGKCRDWNIPYMKVVGVVANLKYNIMIISWYHLLKQDIVMMVSSGHYYWQRPMRYPSIIPSLFQSGFRDIWATILSSTWFHPNGIPGWSKRIDS